MVNFNWDELVRKTNGNPQKLVKELPNLAAYKGNSFILDLKSLIEAKASNVDKMQYLGLCSLRNYADYILVKDATLGMNHTNFSEFDIKRNNLLILENDRIKFLFEERYKNGKELW